MSDFTPENEANPYAPPQADLVETDNTPSPEDQRPVPFEDYASWPGFWSRVGQNFALAFSSPFSFFRRIPNTTGLGAPWRFAILLSAPLLLIMLLFFGLVGFVAFMDKATRTMSSSSDPAWIMLFVFGGMLLLAPLFMFLTMVILGALNHFFLWVWGGLKQGESIEQTCRAVGYGMAFVQLVAWVPILGLFAQLAVIILTGIGLARIHRTETWRGVCAVLTPVMLCCGCYLAFFLIGIAGTLASR